MPVQPQESMRAGVLGDLQETYRQKAPIFEKQQNLLVRKLPKTNLREARYPFKESTPFPEPRAYGAGRNYQSFKDRVITLGLNLFDVAIEWDRFDEADDQIGDLRQQVDSTVNRFLMLPDVLIAEYFNGTASYNYSLKNCYDGATMFSATDGAGANRMGVSGGNLVTGSGLAFTSVSHDLFTVSQRFSYMVDPTAGKPIFSPDEVNFNKLHVIFPNSLSEIFYNLAEAKNLRLDTMSYGQQDNILVGKFGVHPNPYLTNTKDYYVVVEHSYWKPFVFRAPDSPEHFVADINNSDHSREYNKNAIIHQVRTDIGPWMPATIIKVANS